MNNKNNKIVLLSMVAIIQSTFAASLNLSQTPLFLSTTTIPNIMILYGNSNSMDSQADGQAVGSADADSKSQITRTAVKNLISNYQNRVNMGLMAYAQNGISAADLSNSPYDASYNPAHYDPDWTGARESTTHKKFRVVNPTDTSRYIYYNVALPSYNTSVQNDKTNNNLFCFTNSKYSKAFSNGEVIANNNLFDKDSGTPGVTAQTFGRWMYYNCYKSKKGTVNAGPTDASSANRASTSDAGTAGYSNSGNSNYYVPGDSDLAQGITNFGNQITQSYVSQAWESHTSPGYGYVHIPIATLNSAQTTKINTKLGTAQFTVANTQTNSAYPLINAGLTPLAGAINTASSYFGGTLSSAAQGGTFTAPPNSCGKNYLLMLTDGLPSVLSNGTISYDKTALLNDLTTSVGNLKTNRNVLSYVVGFALPYGVSISQLNNIAVAGGTNTPFYADDPATLSTALNSVFSDIISRTSAASSVALNSGYISSSDKVYQARFSSADWSGDIFAIPLDANGTLPTDIISAANWKAASSIATQSATSRVILTSKASTGRGIAFRWPSNVSSPTTNELDTAQTTLLSTNPNLNNVDINGQLRLNYLRGDQSQEPTLFRKRSSVLGDIINSSPVLVKAPQSNYLTSDYLSFKTTYNNRTPIIYVGSNDGMLHGFNANTGKEVLGYIPNAVFSNLNQLTSLNYAHRYYVDGSPNVSDVKYSDNSWHSILISGMGSGATGIFALDVTNPNNFNEDNANSIVKFEYTNAQNADVGYIQGVPSIVKLNNGKWAAVFGNGWNNGGTGKSSLLIVDIQTGSLIKQITTSAGTTSTPNGLANPTLVDTDGNGTVDYAYAGDLYGNMWKFDISDSNTANWAVSLNGSALFSAGSTKPITTQPEVTLSPNGGYMVLFGTGQYLQNSDLTTISQQTFYGIWDNNAVVTSPQLQQQTINQPSSSYRNVSTTLVNYPTQKGWYMNLLNSGERSVTDSILAGGNVYFSTLTPSNATCSYGGTSWLMGVNYLHGNQNSTPIFDSNGDNKVNGSDTAYGGVSLLGISSAPTILKGLGDVNNPLQELFFNLSSGNVTGVYTSGNKQTSRRTSWKTLIKQ